MSSFPKDMFDNSYIYSILEIYLVVKENMPWIITIIERTGTVVTCLNII